MGRIVEIRIYKLKSGSRATFHRLVHEESIPLVKEWGHDVIAYGPSVTDPDSYFLARAYNSIEQMQTDQDAFYSSEIWRKGPREAIVALIEQQSEVVIELSEESIEALRSGYSLPQVVETLR